MGTNKGSRLWGSKTWHAGREEWKLLISYLVYNTIFLNKTFFLANRHFHDDKILSNQVQFVQRSNL